MSTQKNMSFEQSSFFNKVLCLMLVYYSLSVGFNVVSLIRIELGNTPLIQGNPMQSILLLTLFLVLAYSGYKHWRWPFIGIGLFGFLTLPIRGIIPHINALLDPEKLIIYSSETVVWIAIAINCFGLTTLILGFCYAPFLKRVKETL